MTFNPVPMESPPSNRQPEWGRGPTGKDSRSESPWPLGIAPADWPTVGPQAIQILEAIRQRRYPILLAGDVGRGKSCAAALIWSLFAVADRSPIFAECATLLGTIMAARTSETGRASVRLASGELVERSEDAIVAWIERAPLLVLDDVGSRDLTEPQIDALLRLVNARYGRPLVVTTNHTARTLPVAVGDRVASRLRAGATFLLSGADRRIAK